MRSRLQLRDDLFQLIHFILELLDSVVKLLFQDFTFLCNPSEQSQTANRMIAHFMDHSFLRRDRSRC